MGVWEREKGRLAGVASEAAVRRFGEATLRGWRRGRPGVAWEATQRRMCYVNYYVNLHI